MYPRMEYNHARIPNKTLFSKSEQLNQQAKILKIKMIKCTSYEVSTQHTHIDTTAIRFISLRQLTSTVTVSPFTNWSDFFLKE